MKSKKYICYYIIILLLILSISCIQYTFARYVLTKTLETNISTSATENSGTIDVAINYTKNTYIIQDQAEKVDLLAQITLTNKDKININSYYAWTNSLVEPNNEAWQEFSFVDNKYEEISNKGIGNYYLWVKIQYQDELGQQKTIIRNGTVVNVILGDIEITLEDEDSKYLSGDVVANIAYKGQFTQNCKVGYGTTEEEAKQNAKTENKDSITISKEEIDTVYYIYAYAENESGQSIDIVRAISNIDNVKPTIKSVTATNKRIILNLSDNKSGIKAYTVTTTATEPTTYENILENPILETQVTITGLNQGTKYFIWIKDEVGNIAKEEVTTQKLSYTLNPDASIWTKDKVTLKFQNIENCILTYNLDSGATYNYNTETGIILDTNCEVNYQLQDGNETVTGKISITNIDKTAPNINATSDYYKITLNATDGESGIVGYFVTDTEPTDIEKVTFNTCNKTKNLVQEIKNDYLGNELIYNQKYYIYVKDSVGNISVSEVTSKIDNISPTIEITNTIIETNSVQIFVNGIDNESQITGTYRYFISETEGVFAEEPDFELQTNYCTFENLISQKQYYIKIETTDLAGNVGKIEKEIITNELTYTNGDVEFLDATWVNNIQTVTLNTKTKYKMQYQIVKQGGTLSLQNTDWSEALNSGDIVTGLENTDTLYVRLFDGTNVTKTHATYNVINTMAEKYSTLTDEQIKNIRMGTFDILTYSINPQQAKVSASEEKNGILTYNYYTKNIKDDTYKLMSTSTKFDEQSDANFEEEGQTYSTIIIALSNDELGTLTKSQNRTITIADKQVVSGTYYDTNRTYIDSNNYSATVPARFKVSTNSNENTIESGLVLSDESENEFVWIPVENAIYDEITAVPINGSSTLTYKPIARLQEGSSKYFEHMFYNYGTSGKSYTFTNAVYRLGSSNYIEPSLITGSNYDKYTWNISNAKGNKYDASSENYQDILGFNNISEFGNYLNNEYTSKMESINTYCGFYIGRYETTNNDNGKIGSKANSEVLNLINWYQLFLYQDSNRYNQNQYYNNIGIISSMMSGAEYDAILNFILKGDDKSKLYLTNIGNKSNRIVKSGNYSEDKMCNIYDLASNAYEFTTESYGNDYRVYRGGSFDLSDTKKAIDRNNAIPTESGVVFGSRMSLHIMDTVDTTPPTLNFEVSSEINSIQVTVNAIDNETGINNYYYSISEDNVNWTEDIVISQNTYKFENLKMGTKYYIRVKVDDRYGNISEYKQNEITTKIMSLEENSIYLSKVYGSEGNGVAILGVNEEFSNQGYYVKYQVVHDGEIFDENGTWQDGSTIFNLSQTDVIYAKLTDGVNNIEGYMTITLTGLLEEFSNKYTKTEKYTDSNGDEAYIPAGFKVGTSSTINTIDNGLVIEDENGNQFVWVPVENAVYDETTNIPTTSSEASQDTTMYRPMARLQSGSTRYYEGMNYSFTTENTSFINTNWRVGQSYYSEPRLVTNTSSDGYTWDVENRIVIGKNYDAYIPYYKNILGFTTIEEYGKYMNEEYTNMVNSVSKYGGFYIGRTETSVENKVAQSQIGKTAYTKQYWYYMYQYQDSNRCTTNPYYNNNSVISSMIWNSQWDATLNWILKGNDKNNVSDMELGNHGDVVNKTGASAEDISNNILDLNGNVAEWNQAGYSSWQRVYRGGSSNQKHDRRIDGSAGNIRSNGAI